MEPTEKMAATGKCKEIEKCIKDMLFNTVGPQELKPNVNHGRFSVDDRCLVSNIEKMTHLPQNSVESPFGGISSASNMSNQSGTSELIDLNVLTTFAAQHIEDPTFSSSNLALNSKNVKLPHPDLEEDCNVRIKNGEQNQDVAVFLNTISKEIQKSPHFLSMPENPLPQIPGSPKGLDVYNNPHLPYSPNNNSILPDSKQKDPSGTDKNFLKKKKKVQKKNSKEKKVKERPPGSNISKDSAAYTGNKKSVISKEDNNVRNRSPVISIKKKDIKLIEKPTSEEPSEPRPDIKMKKSVFASIGKEYSFYKNEGTARFQCHICNWSNDSKEAMANHLNTKVHRSLKSQNDLDMMLPFLPEPLLPQTEAITDLLATIVSTEGLQKADRDIRENLSLRLKKFVKDHLTSCSVDLVGSSAFGCGLKSSEVDFVLKVDANGDIPDALENLYEHMKKDNAYERVINDFKKKRPCIKFVDCETTLPCNILIDTGSCLKIASLLSVYFQLDDRVQTLGTALRYWAKLCHIDLQDYGTLPSFCYALFMVHFLQQVQPPVLPVLHELTDFSSEFYEQYLLENKWKSQNTDSVGTLWLKFFQYYNFDYKIGENVVCIRSSKRATCKEKNWSTKFYAVEDPFMKRNIAYVIPTYQVCHYIQQCFIRTYRYFAYPQLKSGSIQLLKTESFDALKLSEYVPNTPILKEGSDESEESENEAADQINAMPELEDHDQDISIEDFVSTVSNLSLKESSAEDTVVKSEELPSPDSTVSENSLPKKQGDKSSKECQSKVASKITEPICYWDVEGKKIIKEEFNYEFRAVTFKGEKNVPLTCKLCKSSGHQKKDCPNDDLPPVRNLPKMTSEFMDTVSNVLISIRDRNAVSQEDIKSIEVDMLGVQGYIRDVFPDATLKLFGSFCNGFGFKNNSDMDFCLTFGDRNDGKDLDSVNVIEKIAQQLHHHPELENIISITSAKVPIVKFSWKKTGIEGDISLYNTLALVNTEMLDAYSKIDSRVQILGYALKHFAKHLGICDASRGSLSSYAYILMVIYFLQQRNPPVIPVLQELYSGDEEKPSHLIEGWNVWFFRNLDKLKEVWPDYGKNTETVGELWLGLLCFYTCDFDWKEYVISIKQKKLLSRFRKLWSTNQLAIEDPFDLNHNLGAGLSRKMNSYILKAFIRARERFGTPVLREGLLHDHEVYLFHRNFLNSGVEPPQDRGCSNCGKIGHIARNCPVEKTCSFCRQPGHLIKNCPRKRGKKPRDRHQKSARIMDADHKDRDERRNMHNSNQKYKNDYVVRPFPGMSQQPPMPDLMQGKKLAQLGIPAHRLPPPGFAARGIIPNPPPGFKPNMPMSQAMGNYPPPFSGMEPPIMPPFPRGGNKNDMHAQSSPKQYSSSPPKNFLPNKPAFHQSPDSPWTMGRPGFHVEGLPGPPGQRNMPADRHPAPQGRRNMQVERHLGPQQQRNHPWPERKPFRFPAPNRTNSDNIPYNSNHVERW